MNPLTTQYKIIGALVLAVALTGFCVLGTQQVLKWKQEAQQGASRGETLSATSDVLGQGARAQQETQRVEQEVAAARGDYHQVKVEVMQNEPSSRDWGAQPVPVSLRDAARQRRIARERSGCADGQCPRSGEAQDAR